MSTLNETLASWNCNILNFSYAAFLVAPFLNIIDDFLPDGFKQCLRYGKHCHTGSKMKILTKLEVPKSLFSHFYIFATALLIWSIYLMVQVISLNGLPSYIDLCLDFFASNREVLVDTTSATIALALMGLHYLKRMYETIYVQVFSKNSKINVFYYMVAYAHFFGVTLAMLAYTEGFVKGSTPTGFSISKITYLQYCCIYIFLFSTWQQFKCNLILANMRKDRVTGKVITEKHFIPHGGYFEWISSPHMLFDIMVYVSLLPFMAKSLTWWLIVIWVICNQLTVATFTHRWYKDNFKDYPVQRKAIIPFIY